MRRWLGWSQRTLEARSGVDQTSICRVENGKAPGMRVARLARIVAALDSHIVIAVSVPKARSDDFR